MRNLGKRLAFAALVGVGGSLASAACSSGGSGGGGGTPIEPPPPPTAELAVQVAFPSESSKTATASIHVWALAPRTEGAATCSALIGGELDPYDLSLERRADVAGEPSKLPLVASEVLLGPILVYAEAVSFVGEVELAGCVPADVAQPSTNALVTLQAAGVFDCGDSATEPGAPCDDGMFCTIGETCSGGQCKGGVARDCTHVADDCTAESCDEALGCAPVAVPDGTPCEDGLFCTDGDVCTAGACSGAPRDCSMGVGPCSTPTGCDETFDQCTFQDAPFGTPCDDGAYCTENDSCNSFGSCTGTTRDCSAVADQCNNASCDETADTCVATPKSSAFSCNDSVGCTVSDQCDGLGQCAGTPKSCTSLDDQCNVGTCTEPLGTCVKTPIASGTPCDDGNPATLNDVCTAGVCAGT